MATTDNTQTIPTDEVTPVEGFSDVQSSAPQDLESPDKPAAEADETEPIINDAQESQSAMIPDSNTDANAAIRSKVDVNTPTDFFERYKAAQDQAEFSSSLQSKDTYWNDNPVERQRYESQYGADAKDKFESDYKVVEQDWRRKLNDQQNKTVMNDRYSWLFGDGDDISYDTAPVFEAVNEISNGSRRIDTLLTDQTQSDRQAAVGSKTFMNDNGELITLGDDEKYWIHSQGGGFEMNYNDPKYLSKDGRKIVGFEYVPMPPEFRGKAYIKAIYDGDVPKGEIVSAWDTCNTWMNSNGLETKGLLNKVVRTTVRTADAAAIDIITGFASLMGSTARLLDKEDSTEFVKWANNVNTKFKQLKLSTSDYDQKHPVTLSNAIGFVENMATLIIGGAGIAGAVGGLTKVLGYGGDILTAARAAEAAGETAKAARLFSQFEMKYGFAARTISAFGINLQMSNAMVDEARAAGFNEDDVAKLYLTDFIALYGATAFIQKLATPYLTNATLKPIVNQVIKGEIPAALAAKTDLAKYAWAKRTILKVKAAIEKIPGGINKLSAEAVHGEGMQSFKSAAIHGVVGGEAYWLFGQSARTFGTMMSKMEHKGEKEIPKFDTFMDDGYWSRQLAPIMMNALGGAVGAGITHLIPGFQQQNEDSFLIQGEQSDRMKRIAMVGGRAKKVFLKQLSQQKESGALSPKELSIKMNDKTGEYYKMTDPEAAGTFSQAEASYRTILNQFLVYETLYGGAAHSYDQLIKDAPWFKDSLEYQKDHVFHQEMSDLHTQKQKLIKDLSGTVKVSPANEKDAKTKPPTKPVEKVLEDINKKTEAGVTEEPAKPDVEKVNKEAKVYSEMVLERAKAFENKDYEKVSDLIKIEQKIDDMLSGNAAAQQVARSVARQENIKVFMKDQQKNVFDPVQGSDGKMMDNPFLKHGDDLLEMAFSSDSNLAAGHGKLHGDYVEAAKVALDFITSKFTPEELTAFAANAVRKPNSIAIDRDTTQLTALKEGMEAMVTNLIGKGGAEKLISSARISYALDKTTNEYKSDIEDAYVKWMVENNISQENENETFSRDEIESFVAENIDLVHKASISTLLDRLEKSPIDLLSTSISQNKLAFAKTLIDNIEGSGRVTIGGYDQDTSVVDGLEKSKVKLSKDLEAVKAKEGKTQAEKTENQREEDRIRKEITLVNDKLARAATSFDSGALDMVISNYGANSILEMSSRAPKEEVSPIIKSTDENVTKARTAISDYGVILANIAPIVPTVPKLGAVYNLLNEISATDTGVKSTINKLITEDENDIAYTHLASGQTVLSSKQPTLIEQLEATILRPNTEMEEFRNLAGAKKLMDSINIRIGQVELLTHLMPSLDILRNYTKTHIPESGNKYDAIPKFMAEYVFDSKRYKELKDKAILTQTELKDLSDMSERENALTNWEAPESVHSRLIEAKKRVQRLIDMGEKSQTANERTRVYKTELAKGLNGIKSGLKVIHLENLSPVLDQAIADLDNVADTFIESNGAQLVRGKAVVDNLQRALFALPLSVKEEVLKSVGYHRMPTTNSFRTIIDGMAVDVDAFNHFYAETLTEVRAKDPNMTAPTYAQEQMIRSVFSYLTDPAGIFPKLSDKKFPLLFFVNGLSGTGKTTMVGHALRAVQKYYDTKSEAKFGPSTTERNTVLFSANLTHQAETLKARCTKLGVEPASSKPLDKYELFKRLDNPKDILDNIGMIAMDEATFIQGHNDEGKSELEILHDRLSEINSRRVEKGIAPIKMIMIGDNTQGGWQKGMPTINSPIEDRYKPIDYDALEPKRSFVSDLISSDKLEYAFRSSCEKISETSNRILGISMENFRSMFGASKLTTKLTTSYGRISNDVKERERLGGVKIAKSTEELYNDRELTDNIARQIRVDNEQKVPEDKKFSVIIIDEKANDVNDASILPDSAVELKRLVAENPSVFKFYNVEGVQGQEADYVIANISQLIPRLPITSEGASSKLERVAMAIARAKLFAKMSVSPTANIEEVNNAIITMLPEQDAAIMSKEWNDFYLDEYHKIKQPVDAPKENLSGEGKVPGAEKEPTTEDPTNTNASEQTTNSTETKSDQAEEQQIFSEEAPIKSETKVVPIEYVSATTVAPEAITDVQAQKRRDKAEAILMDKNASDEDKQKAKESLDNLEKNTIPTVDVVNTPVKYTAELEKNIGENIETNNKKYHRKDDEGVKMLEALENKFGIVIVYGRISPETTIVNHAGKLAQYAADLWGWSGYKQASKNGGPSSTINNSAKTEIKMAQRAILGMNAPGEPSLNDYRNISLVSFQIYDKDALKDVVVHQIYLQRSKNSLKVPVLAIPGPKTLDAKGTMGSVLLTRETALTNLSTGFSNLSKNAKTKGNFVSMEAKQQDNAYGPAGLAMTNEVLARIKTQLIENGFKANFPDNTETTKFGRTSVSDQNADYRSGKTTNGDQLEEHRKISVDNFNSGLFYMETKLSDSKSIFKATTAGKPLRDSRGGRINYASVTNDLRGFPEDGKKFSNTLLDVIRAKVDSRTKVLSSKNVTDLITDNFKLVKPVIVDGEKYHVMKVGEYNVITLSGNDKRSISLVYKKHGDIELVFGFSSDGKPIKANNNPEITDGDLEMRGLAEIFKQNNINESDLKKGNHLTPNLTWDKANEILSKLHNYDWTALDKLPDQAKLTAMSRDFVNKKIESFEDKKVSFAQFKDLMKKQNIQVSDPLAFTKSTEGGHEGKAFVLYTHHDKSKFDLSNTNDLSMLVNNIAIYKPDGIKDGQFDAEQFTRQGVGIIMLDNKMQSLTEIAAKLSNVGPEDINRATGLIKSASNRRMIAFAKELTQIVHDYMGEDRTSEEYVSTHGRLKKLGIKSDGNPVEKIFDPTVIKDIHNYLKNANPDIVNQLHELLTLVTADENMGKMVATSFDEPPRIQKLLAMDLADRVEYWKTYLENPANRTVKEQESITQLGLSKTNLSTFTPPDLTPEGRLRGGTIQGSILVDEYGIPLVISSKHGVITFIPSDILSEQAGKQVDPETGAFNMVNFINAARKVATQHGTTSEGLTSLIDNVMRNYATKGTLNRGIMWSGRRSGELDRQLGVTKLLFDDANSILETSVKEIDMPSMLVSIPELVKQLTEVKAPTVDTKVSTVVDKTTSLRDDLMNYVKNRMSQIPEGMTKEQIEEIHNEVMRDIAQAFSGKEGLFKDGNITTMKSEIEHSLKTQVDAKIAKIPAESLLPVPDETAVRTLLATSGGYSNTDALLIPGEIKTDIRLAMDSATPAERVNNLEAISRAMAAEPRVGDNDRTAFTEEIQNHLKTMSTVPTTPDTAGESFVKAMQNNLKNPTQSQIKVLDQLLRDINDVKFDEGLIPDVIDLLTNPDKVKAMPDADRIKFEERASDALAQLSFLVGDRMTEEQYSDFDKITRKLQKPKC